MGVAATNEFAVEVLEAMLEMFDAKIQCHGPHSALLKEISMRVKVLLKMREYLEGIFGKANEGHQFVDEFRLAKIRYVCIYYVHPGRQRDISKSVGYSGHLGHFGISPQERHKNVGGSHPGLLYGFEGHEDARRGY